MQEEDFRDGQMKQVLCDLSVPSEMNKWQDVFCKAEFFFVDGPKDKRFESEFLKNLRDIPFKKAPLLVFDDIRDWNMRAPWRNITKPKLDITSFGHWTGTGFVDWTIDSEIGQ